MVRNESNVQRRARGERCIFDDDCGVWNSSEGRTLKLPYLKLSNGEFKRLFLHNDLYCFERVIDKQRTYVQYDPQPGETDVVVLCRYYATLKGESYKKRVSSIIDELSTVVVVEYVGKPKRSLAHGNNRESATPYMRTPATTMDRISKSVPSSSVSVKNVYDLIVKDCDDEYDAPRNSRVVRNKKYAERAKDRAGNSKAYSATFGDEVQQICCMVTADDNFVQTVILNHARVPCIILYTSRQIADIKAFCFNKRLGSIWSVDKTYNLGKLYVTVTVYRNMALQRTGTNSTPAFIGPLFVHGNSDFETYNVFFSHLSARLADCDFKQLRLGSDEEASLRKAMHHCFHGSSIISCTRHLKENVIRNAHKVS
jgi:hypothetical protein